VVLFGTSLTAGLGLDPAVAYPALLQEKADSAGYRVELVNAGLSGETSAGALRRAEWVLDQPAAAVVLEVGANDGLRGVNPDSTYANLVALVRIIRRDQPAARVLLVQMEAPTNLGREYTTRFHATYARVARESGIPLLPFLLDGVAGNAALNQADGIHPNPAGSRIVANTMWKALAPTFVALDSARTAPTPTPDT
jgi:acyl-CoA thioesterase-1